MPSIYDLKPRFQALLALPAGALARAGVTANQVTLSAALLSLALGLALVWQPGRFELYLLLPPFLFLRMALNAIDGMLARQYGQKSALGGILNEAGDVVSDAALYLPFALLPGIEPAWVVLAVLLAGLTEFIGVSAVAIGASRRYDGPMGKSDRAFWFGALALALGLLPGRMAPSYLNGFMILIDLLLAYTCWNRAQRALAEVRA